MKKEPFLRTGYVSLPRLSDMNAHAEGQYAIHSHPKIHEEVLSQEQIDNAVIALEPREGEDILRTEDIVASIQKYGDEVSRAPCMSAISMA